MRRAAAGIVVVFCLNAPARAEMFKIENPASNIYNPADRMNNPNPLSPPTQPAQEPAAAKEPATATPTATPPPPEQARGQRVPQQRRAVPPKSSSFKTAQAYLAAANRAYTRGDYRRFLAISEEALNRIRAGTLTASKKTKQKLVRNRAIGRGLLEKGDR
ncbi:hypothetical protein F6V25_14715 [Oryzomonas japonica]|uniref:Uncharacterized protein n=1 Tax=Oryzomonas japonica TaxID=2603858 RepID=A0A7J4ZMU4_9BACT|nr:hypothetical protein [Oryzomonas japonica]KAB0664056.1 hypothetical protein F6V25_14715 [Oryzomonas japonica]